jgi:hypothetical protein
VVSEIFRRDTSLTAGLDTSQHQVTVMSRQFVVVPRTSEACTINELNPVQQAFYY